jgi:hypothetical protein
VVPFVKKNEIEEILVFLMFLGFCIYDEEEVEEILGMKVNEGM